MPFHPTARELRDQMAAVRRATQVERTPGPVGRVDRTSGLVIGPDGMLVSDISKPPPLPPSAARRAAPAISPPPPEFSPAPRTVAPKKSELPVLPDEDDVLEIIPVSVFEPMPAESFVHKRIGGALRGFVTGGPVGAAAGFITGGGGAPRSQVVTDPCPGGFKIPGTTRCFQGPVVPQEPAVGRGFSPGQLGGGGRVEVGTVSAGMFGALSTEPQEVQSFRLQCPRGLVLGKDERCYAKGTIPPKLRKWRPATRPPVTAGDARAVRRAAATKTRVKKLAKDVGLHVHVHHRATAAKKGKK